MRSIHSLKVALSLAILLLTLLLPLSSSAASTKAWDFSNPADCSYDSSLVEVSGGTAHSKTLDLENGWWTKTFDCGNIDTANAVSCDGSGNPVVAGWTHNFITGDIWVRKYSGEDGSALWTKIYDGGDYDRANAVSCDESGNPVVAGYTDNGSDYDIWVRKYSGEDGSALWTKIYDGGDYDRANAVSCDGSGNPVVAGDIDNGIDYDIWVRKYSGTDGNTLWTSPLYDSGNEDYANAVSCDGSGNPVVAGYTYNGTDFNIWVRKYSGEDGSALWTKTYDSGDDDNATAVSCDGSGNPVVAGYTYNGTDDDIWVRKYSGEDGSALWTKIYDSGDDDRANAVSCDPSGNLVVAGSTCNDIWVRKYSGEDGSTLWTKTYDSGADYGYGVSCDLSGNPVVAGHTDSGTDEDIWVRKYTPGNYALFPSVTTETAVDLTNRYMTGFSETLGAGNQGSITYQLSADKTAFYYYNGSSWVTADDDYSKSNTAQDVNSHIADFNTIATSRLYVRAYLNSNGMQYVSLDEIEVTFSNFYLAEGYTGDNFQEYICLCNAGDSAANANVTYMFTDGTNDQKTYNVPAKSRYTVNVNEQVGPGKEVSIKVESESPSMVVERPMYFNYNGVYPGGHDAVGAPSPAKEWYFAEGTTLPGFDEYITVQNPGGTGSDLTFHYMVQGEGEKVVTDTIGANSRATFNVRNQVGDGKTGVSLFLESTEEIVAERPVYFHYSGLANNNWTGGHCVVGTNSPDKKWYFAEGTTRGGFEEWLCIQNPSNSDITVDATYILGEGQGAPVEKSYTIPALGRETVSVNTELGPDKDVSTTLTCDTPFIAERPLYFNYNGICNGGHDVLGANSYAGTWFFAEGYTGDNFQEYLCIMNPEDKQISVEITYYPEGGAPIVKTHTVDPNSRKTVDVNTDAGPGLSISAKVTSDDPIAVERPMYFNFNGWPGGHDVVGSSNGS